MARLGKGSVLLLDYDGTLAPFVKDRMQAYPYPGVPERLQTLSKLSDTRTVIISGRSLDDLEKLLPEASGLELWGSHGLERKSATGKMSVIAIDPHIQQGVKEGIQLCMDLAGQARCENKPFGVALHWRDASEQEALRLRNLVEPLWLNLCERYELEIHSFDGGIELRPKARNKGTVVEEILSTTPKDAAITYLGDDLTDEDAFKALGARGLKVLVREQSRPTLADVQLTPPQELLQFLDQWIAAVQKRTA